MSPQRRRIIGEGGEVEDEDEANSNARERGRDIREKKKEEKLEINQKGTRTTNKRDLKRCDEMRSRFHCSRSLSLLLLTFFFFILPLFCFSCILSNPGTQAGSRIFRRFYPPPPCLSLSLSLFFYPLLSLYSSYSIQCLFTMRSACMCASE